ncbi:MAG: DUF3108 domain-containing protein [Tannerella sp.]|uniref:DUF3108 domain-containing protein n=1 Tax=Tannerella sp. TaxID=2382127 RepID=UPI003FA1E00A
MLREKNVIIKKKAGRPDARRAVPSDCRSKYVRIVLVVSCALLFASHTRAQCLPSTLPINHGETVNYDIYFKWGLLMSRAGEASLSFGKATYQGQSASRYRLHFRTVNLFESVYRMRDTMDCYYAPDYSLLFSSKHTHENHYYLIDELTFSYRERRTSIRSRRYTSTETKIDTTLIVRSGCAFDMLGATFFLRTLDRKKLKTGDTFPMTVAIGKDLVKISCRYQGQAVVERGNIKYRTLHFSVDIYDKAFTQTKAAAELWIGDDDNFIPVKIRSKLKIGYAEVHYRNASGLKVPLHCRIETKR